MWIIKAAHLKAGIETIQLKVISTSETNTMMEQTWVITKTLWHKTSFSLLDQDHMNNDQVHKSRKVENKVNNQWTHHAKRSQQTSPAQEARCKIEQL
jgi:hypothetical protein